MPVAHLSQKSVAHGNCVAGRRAISGTLLDTSSLDIFVWGVAALIPQLLSLCLSAQCKNADRKAVARQLLHIQHLPAERRRSTCSGATPSPSSRLLKNDGFRTQRNATGELALLRKGTIYI